MLNKRNNVMLNTILREIDLAKGYIRSEFLA
jgi:hypothetical protein